MRQSPRSSRGTSVIAALVFAALLGTVALGLHAFQSSSASPAALSAQSAAPGASNTQTIGSTQTCPQVIAAAAAYGTETPPQKVTDYSTSDNLKDSCNAAVQNPATIAEVKAQYPNDWQYQTQTYKCVGKSGTLTISPITNTLTETLKPDASVDAGQCSVQDCTAGSNGQPSNCQAATVLSGINSSTLASSGIGSTPIVSPDTPLSTANPWGGQTINCDANPSQCPATTPANDPNTYCYDNSTTCYPPDNVTSMSGYTCNDVSGVTTCTANTTSPPAQGPCQNGQVMAANGTCGAAPAANPPPGSGANNTKLPTTQAPAAQQSQNPLSSLLSGLVKGLTSPCTTAPQSQYVGGNGTTLVPQQVLQPNGTYTTVYVQQSATTPYGTTQPCSPLTSAQAPYGVGNNGAACTAPPAMPTCATGATAQPISASGNGCVTSYQCVPTAGSTFSQTPTPQISCSPQVADVGMSVAISYSCANATDSSGAGFTTNDQTSGSTSTVITTPPSGTNTANFGLTCINGSQTAGAQCSVQINQPAIVLVANPQTVPSGQPSTIGWVTAGMQSCVISSPQDATFTASNASNQSINGVAQTDAITQSTEFDLTCTTLGGQTKGASTILVVGSATSTQ